jgi:hypothetical protein
MTEPTEQLDYLLGRLHRLHRSISVTVQHLTETEDDLARQSLAAGSSYEQVGSVLELTGEQLAARLRSHANAGR